MSDLSRRGLFSLFARPLRPVPSAPARRQPVPDLTRVAVIQGVHCTALLDGCQRCLEHCPEAGAIFLEHGLPMVLDAACTGCGVCRDVCPAPDNAVLLLPRPPAAPRPPGPPPMG
jgi:Pyruvate/2-oxoacid:ferredoxin oxidoreductase delta subunit